MNDTLYDDLYASCNVISGDEFKSMITTIAQIASDIVVKTLGPYGSTTLISDGTGFTYPSKDGWASLNNLRFTDPDYNTLLNLIKQISFNSANTVGDGTTSAMVGANYFLHRLNEVIESKNDIRQADFINAVQRVADKIEKKILASDNIRKIESSDDIYNIAYIATNGNEKFSKIIADIYNETDNPNIHVVLDKSSNETTYEVQTGYKFNANTINFDVYINDSNKSYKNNTLVNCVIFDHNVTYNEHKDIISGLSSLASIRGVEMIIMAPYFDDIITSIINNHAQMSIQQNQVPNIMLVQIPVSMEAHRKTLADLAVLTNTHIFEHGLVRAFNILLHNQTHGEDEQITGDVNELEAYEAFASPQQTLESCLGTIRSIVIEKHYAFLQDYEEVANKIMYDNIVREATETYEKLKEKANKTLNGHLDKDFMEAHLRYVKLLGKTGVIRIGAMSDLQRRCDKDAIDDAVLACRSAYENGYIRGLNLETLTTISNIYNDEFFNNGASITYYRGIDNEISYYNSSTNTIDDYERDALEMLYYAFHQVSLSVLRNRYPDDDKKRRVTIINADTDNSTVNMCNTEIISYCIQNGYGYNLNTNQIECSEKSTVINSVATDLEILKAIVNILSIIMTSNQYISTSRAFDKKVNHDQQLARLVSDKKAVVRAITQEIINTIKEDEEAIDILLNIGSPMLGMGMLPEEYDEDEDMK